MRRINSNAATSQVKRKRVNNRKTCFILLLMTTILMLVPSLSLAMPPMKKTNFEAVFASSSVSECPFDNDLVNEKWVGELLRARLKQTPNSFEDGVLWLAVQCMELDALPGTYAFYIEGQWTWSFGNGDGIYPIHLLSDLLGVGERDFIIQGVEQVMDQTITKYLKANLE